ncbi:hypothetical protein TorRG33x02_245230 [Trema orientale]|uniref:Uncharacterized protein n=1 Tax=Trema orientale TaxID=63057 RepID=A0A2P5DQ92_TREOI|nr:hypothetical protein TorRG33x02_245230 [Trema orientale]
MLTLLSSVESTVGFVSFDMILPQGASLTLLEPKTSALRRTY